MTIDFLYLCNYCYLIHPRLTVIYKFVVHDHCSYSESLTIIWKTDCDFLGVTFFETIVHFALGGSKNAVASEVVALFWKSTRQKIIEKLNCKWISCSRTFHVVILYVKNLVFLLKVVWTFSHLPAYITWITTSFFMVILPQLIDGITVGWDSLSVWVTTTFETILSEKCSPSWMLNNFLAAKK